MTTIIAVGDGMADNPVEMLGKKTPLEKAEHPMLDELAQKGELGLVRTIPKGIAPGSDTAFLSILGYDPQKYFSGRAPLEAAGCGVVLNPGELAYRCNIIALEDGDMPLYGKRILSHSADNVEGKEALELMNFLLQNADFAAILKKNKMRFHTMPAFRQIAVQTGVSPNGLSTTPPHDHLGEAAGPLLPKGGDVAKGLHALMDMAHSLLQSHPLNEKRRKENRLLANGIWFWAEGMTLKLDNFKATHKKTGTVVSAVPLVHGIAALIGLNSTYVEGATGELNTNFEGKAEAVVTEVQGSYDFALLHVEAPDECTHNGDIPGKVQAIEAFDKRCVSHLVDGLRKIGEPFRLLVLSDHKTLSSTRGHDADPVPYILYDSQNDDVKNKDVRYTEAFASNGTFVESGPKLLERLFQE